MHVAAPQVLPFPAHCGPLLPRKVPVYEQERQGWGGGGGSGGGGLKKRSKKRGIPVKKKSSRFRSENEISSEKAQCDVFLCIRVTPSINSEVNLDMRYKAELQRKGEKEAYSHLQKLWETLDFVAFLFQTSVPVGHTCCNNRLKNTGFKYISLKRKGMSIFFK